MASGIRLDYKIEPQDHDKRHFILCTSLIRQHENVSARQSRSRADRKEEERCHDTTERFEQVHGVFTKEVSWHSI